VIETGSLVELRGFEPMAIAGEVISRARPLPYFLKNRMYLGEINHGQTSYPGEHGWWR